MREMQEVVVLSDLWGVKKSEWFKYYQKLLGQYYNIKFYDCCELGQINISEYEEKSLHQQFVSFGIENAVNKLLDIEQKPKIYIGCSVGGVIAWKAGQKGLPIDRLITISSTRLRKEIEKPNCPVKMYFGDCDAYSPDIDWQKLIGIDLICIINGGHQIYKDQSSIEQIILDLNKLNWIDLN